MKTFKIIHEYKILDSESYKSFENIMYVVVAGLTDAQILTTLLDILLRNHFKSYTMLDSRETVCQFYVN